jgi:hypothetical protein
MIGGELALHFARSFAEMEGSTERANISSELPLRNRGWIANDGDASRETPRRDISCSTTVGKQQIGTPWQIADNTVVE